MRLNENHLLISACAISPARKQAEAVSRAPGAARRADRSAHRVLLHDRLQQAIRAAQRSATPSRCWSWTWIASKKSTTRLATTPAISCWSNWATAWAGFWRLDTIAAWAATIRGAAADGYRSTTAPHRRATARKSRRAVRAGRLELEIDASIGIGVRRSGTDADTLLRPRRRGYVRRQARQHWSRAVYRRTGPAQSDATAMVGELRRAIDTERAVVCTSNPRCRCGPGMCVGVEACPLANARQRPARARRVRAIAEQTGLIRPLAHWVLNAGAASVQSAGARTVST